MRADQRTHKPCVSYSMRVCTATPLAYGLTALTHAHFRRVSLIAFLMRFLFLYES